MQVWVGNAVSLFKIGVKLRSDSYQDWLSEKNPVPPDWTCSSVLTEDRVHRNSPKGTLRQRVCKSLYTWVSILSSHCRVHKSSYPWYQKWEKLVFLIKFYSNWVFLQGAKNHNTGQCENNIHAYKEIHQRGEKLKINLFFKKYSLRGITRK